MPCRASQGPRTGGLARRCRRVWQRCASHATNRAVELLLGCATVPIWESRLRKELRERAERFGERQRTHSLQQSWSKGSDDLVPGPSPQRRGTATSTTRAMPKSWRMRRGPSDLRSPILGRDALPSDWAASAMELDSSNSSDALLMNCFCYPGAAERILGDCWRTTPTGPVEFGVGGNVPRRSGGLDATELDMRVSTHHAHLDIVCEAKLTESDFTRKRASVVEGYRDLADVFDASAP